MWAEQENARSGPPRRRSSTRRAAAFRSVNQALAQRQAFEDHVRETAGGGSAAEIAKAKELLDAGTITQEEFEALKAKALT
jgi:hypothetical protein